MSSVARVVADSDDEGNDSASDAGEHGIITNPFDATYIDPADFSSLEAVPSASEKSGTLINNHESSRPQAIGAPNTALDSTDELSFHQLDVNFDAFLFQASAKQLSQGGSQPVKSYPEFYRGVHAAATLQGGEPAQVEEQAPVNGSTGMCLVVSPAVWSSHLRKAM